MTVLSGLKLGLGVPQEKPLPRGLMEEVGLENDAGEALELEKDRRGKDLSKKLTSSSKEAEGRLKRKMGLEWPFQPDSSGSLNSMA